MQYVARLPCDRAGLTTGLRRNEHGPYEFTLGERCVMPVWIEILINLIGYGGFIAIAHYHRSPADKFPENFPDR